MKSFIKLFLAAGSAALLFAVSCGKYDDSELRGKITSLENRVSSLEDLIKTANRNIQNLQTLTTGLDKAIFVTAVNKLSDGGYEIVFSSGDPVVIKNGEDGTTPAIGVKKDTDDVYYWTVNGEWLLDSDGNKVRVTGEKGDPGVTPQLTIIDGYWYVSTDGGETWTLMDKATGEDGDSFFKSVTWDSNYVYVTLQDDTVLKLSRGVDGVQAISVVPDFEDGGVLCLLNEFTVKFDVLPQSAAEALAAMDPEFLKVNVVYTRTKADVGEEVLLPVKSAEGLAGRLTVTVDGSLLSEDFAVGKIAANASLSVDDGSHAATSGYFPLKYDKSVLAAVEKQWVALYSGWENIIDVGYSYEKRFFTQQNYDGGDVIGPNDKFDRQYMLYQLPNGDFKLFSDNQEDFYVLRNVTETSAEFLEYHSLEYYEEWMYYSAFYPDIYPADHYTADEYGCYETGTGLFLTAVSSPEPLNWNTLALNIGGKYYAIHDTCADYGLPTFEDAVLYGMEQYVPIVRMNNKGEKEDFDKVDVMGKVAVVDRGGITFAEKLGNGCFAGAIAVICANNQSGVIKANLLGVDPVVNIPLVTVSQKAGQLLNGRTSVSVVYCTDPNEIDED